MNPQNFFLSNLLQKNKLLFSLAVLFIVGQGFFTYKGVETVPFFNYGMYSEVYTFQENHQVIAVYLDTLRIDKYPQSRFPMDFVLETLDYYRQLKERGFSDTILVTINKRFKDRISEESLNKVIERLANGVADKESYEAWAFNFIKSFYHANAKTLRVEVEQYEFVDNRLAFISKELLFEYRRSE